MAEHGTPAHDKPLVSIGVPVYNGVSHVARAMDCLLAQDYPRIEIVVSDNASTDGTTEVLEGYATRYPNVRLMVAESTSSIVENFKRVLAESTGEYFMWAAADDLWKPTFVSALAEELIAHPEAGVAMSAVDRALDDGTLIDTVRFAGHDDPTPMGNIALARALTTPRKYNYFIYGLYRTSVLREAVRHFPEVPGEDRIMLAQMALATRFRYVDEPLQTKTLYELPYEDRRPEDSRSAATRSRTVEMKMVYEMARGTLASRQIPLARKLYAPVLVFRYARLIGASRTARSLGRFRSVIPGPVLALLKRIRRIIEPR